MGKVLTCCLTIECRKMPGTISIIGDNVHRPTGSSQLLQDIDLNPAQRQDIGQTPLQKPKYPIFFHNSQGLRRQERWKNINFLSLYVMVKFALLYKNEQ